MKAISLWQPWASAMAVGAKTIETRHWSTNYRGPLAIHAAKRFIHNEILGLACTSCWVSIFRRCGVSFGPKFQSGSMAFGSIVAVGELVDCVPVERFTIGELEEIRTFDGEKNHPWTERQMGDFSSGRFGWIFTNIQPLAAPVPFIGRQGLFNIPDELVSL
jgi:hypothetical protein